MPRQLLFILKETLINGNTIYEVFRNKDSALIRMKFLQKNYPLDKVELHEATAGD